MLVVFCEYLPEIILSFVVDGVKVHILYRTEFKLENDIYFGTEGVRVEKTEKREKNERLATRPLRPAKEARPKLLLAPSACTVKEQRTCYHCGGIAPAGEKRANLLNLLLDY